MLKNDQRLGVYLLLPALFLLALLIIYPLIDSVVLSLHSQFIYELKGRYVGLSNYIAVLLDNQFWHALWVNIIWTIATVTGQVIVGVIGALLLNELSKAKGLIRGVILLPFFIPTVSVTLMWRWLLDPTYGLVEFILKRLGIIQKSIAWLSSPQFALMTVIFIAIWRYFPFISINVLARLQTIPDELYEAARIDGANMWNEFKYITLPEIAEVLSAVTLLRVVFMYKKVDEILLLTGGGPGNSTETLSVLAYRYAFQGLQFGKGAAISILAFMIFLTGIIMYIKSEYVKESR